MYKIFVNLKHKSATVCKRGAIFCTIFISFPPINFHKKYPMGACSRHPLLQCGGRMSHTFVGGLAPRLTPSGEAPPGVRSLWSMLPPSVLFRSLSAYRHLTGLEVSIGCRQGRTGSTLAHRATIVVGAPHSVGGGGAEVVGPRAVPYCPYGQSDPGCRPIVIRLSSISCTYTFSISLHTVRQALNSSCLTPFVFFSVCRPLERFKIIPF